MAFAESTSVPVERSQAQIKALVQRAGCDQYATFDSEDRAMVVFTREGRMIRFELQLPARSEKRFWSTPGGRRQRSQEQAYQAWEQDCRRAWRALWLVIKAKLEAVETGITTFEDEFLSHFVCANGQTIGQQLVPQLGHVMTENASLVPLLGGPGV